MVNILQNYKLLTETKDRDLLHYAIFSFKNYHDLISKIDVWIKLPENIVNLYYKIINPTLTKAMETQKNSWRYLITCVKAVESIIDSNYQYNKIKENELLAEKSEREIKAISASIR